MLPSRFCQLASLLVAVAGVACIVLGATRSTAQNHSVRAVPLTALPLEAMQGQEVQLDFRLENIGATPASILGADYRCDSAGCVGLVTKCPLTIAPGESVDVTMYVSSIHAGSADRSLELYTDVESQSTIVLTARLDVTASQPHEAQ